MTYSDWRLPRAEPLNPPDYDYTISYDGSADIHGNQGWHYVNSIRVWAVRSGDVTSDPLMGDLDHDGDVDLSDLAQLLSNYGVTSGAEYEDGDLNGDGDVDLSDLAELLSHYGTGT